MHHEYSYHSETYPTNTLKKYTHRIQYMTEPIFIWIHQPNLRVRLRLRRRRRLKRKEERKKENRTKRKKKRKKERKQN